VEAIHQLKTRLTEFPSITYSIVANTVTVKSTDPNGFEVSLVEGEKETSVYYEGWHEHFSSSDEAVKCFLFGLSVRCRIRVSRRGGKAHSWTLEALENDNWVPYGTTGLLFFPFWRERDVIYLQNTYLNA